MKQQETTQTSAETSSPKTTWQDVVRRHTTGPVFSLAFHIMVLVLLGTLVVIVPNAGKDDAEPVQIAELEPVLPPPEEEPTPSDMTVMDTSNPALDRYESNLQQMEDVGVTDVEIMTDLDIPTPLTIPDSNSALKLQGVLPFGRPGGGGDMGDGGEGDGRGNLKGMLQGVFYDLKQTRGGRPTDAMGDPAKENDHTRDKILPVLKEFINGPWRREYDKDGQVHYPALDGYYCSPTRLWNSCFYTRQIKATEAPAAFLCGKEVNTGGWACIYSGNVVAPFSGKFRFVGYADDIMLIRFNKQIVFDYGWYSATLGVNLWYMGEKLDSFKAVLSGRPENERQRRLIADSVIYSKHKLDVYCPEFDSRHGIAKGPVLEVEEGQVYPIEILISEVPGGEFTMLLFVEQLDEDGQPLEPNPDSFTLFRTTLDLPPQNTREDDRRFFMPKFKPYGPIWRVVRSTASGGGSGSGTGTASQSLLGNRTAPRTAVVNEDDEDLSL
ncbi:MAG: hypothetical protein PUC15_04005 [Lentisphaeria bacterium]|nr:hypothetical protein [Lentisphaeria bacterium]